MEEVGFGIRNGGLWGLRKGRVGNGVLGWMEGEGSGVWDEE